VPSRKIEDLLSGTRAKWLAVKAALPELKIFEVCTYRSQEEQDGEWAKGRTAPGPKVTWTPGFASTDNVVTATLFAFGLKATYTSADRKINLTDGTNTISTAALTFATGDTIKLAFRYGPSGLLIYKDGAQAATGATYTAFAVNANLYIGTDTSSANAAYSNIKPVRTWNREFSAPEMGTITTP